MQLLMIRSQTNQATSNSCVQQALIHLHLCVSTVPSILALDHLNLFPAKLGEAVTLLVLGKTFDISLMQSISVLVTQFSFYGATLVNNRGRHSTQKIHKHKYFISTQTFRVRACVGK